MTVYVVSSVNNGFIHRIRHGVDWLAEADADDRRRHNHTDVRVEEMPADEAKALESVERVGIDGI